MKFALLGADDALFSLGSAVLRGGHDLTWVEQSDTLPEELHRAAARVARGSSWEDLLDGTVAEAILIGRGGSEDERAEQLRKLAQCEVPLLVTHPISQSVLVYFELDMIRSERHNLMRHYTPGADHPLIDQLSRSAKSSGGSLGPVEQIVFKRDLPRRNKSDVVEQFVRDADLITRLVGEIHRVGALGADDTQATYANLGVQMSTAAGLVIRWSVGPTPHAASGELTVVGRDGRATLEMPTDQRAWCLSTTQAGSSEPQRETVADWDDTGHAIQLMATAVRERRPDASTWLAAARSVELADAVERSLAKGRTIELHFEQFSEASTFKGVMTTLGCGVLIVGLIMVLIVGLVGDAFGRPWVRGWQFVLLVVFLIFLLLQLLPRLVFSRDDSKPENR